MQRAVAAKTYEYEDMRVAFMRFGLGPKPGGTARLIANNKTGLQACLDELDTEGLAEIDESKVHTLSRRWASSSASCWGNWRHPPLQRKPRTGDPRASHRGEEQGRG
jgi:hypothetical protein